MKNRKNSREKKKRKRKKRKSKIVMMSTRKNMMKIRIGSYKSTIKFYSSFLS
jgi:hypothetical protein